jgi:hypothetical protein
MKKIYLIFVMLIFFLSVNGCGVSFVNRTEDVSNISKIEWKAVYEDLGDEFHLYVIVNGEKDYYAGHYYPGVNFEFNSNEISWVADAPENALAAFSTMWTQVGQYFYIYQKKDDELAVMNHPVIYPEWYVRSVKEEMGDEAYTKEYKEYKEVLVIPVEKGSQIQIEELVSIQRPESD